MTKEQIRAAALEYAEHKTDFRKKILKEVDSDNYTIRKEDCMEDFCSGIEWFINSVWHDVSERPKFPGEIEAVKFLLMENNGECDRYLIDKYGWDAVMGMAKFVKWAYLEDLRPEI